MKKLFPVVLCILGFSGVAFASSDCDYRCQVQQEAWYNYTSKQRYCDRLPYYQATMCRLSSGVKINGE